jgi:hypothetical protein
MPRYRRLIQLSLFKAHRYCMSQMLRRQQRSIVRASTCSNGSRMSTHTSRKWSVGVLTLLRSRQTSRMDHD